MASYLVTGTSRGIGHELVRQLAAKPASEVSTIFATSRSVNTPLQALADQHPGRFILVPIDVTDQDSITKAVAAVESVVGDKGLDVLINNAGVVGWGWLKDMSDLNDTFNVNVTGPHVMIQAFLPLLRRGAMKKIVNISSSVGSIAKQPVFRELPAPSYKITKAALNMITVLYSQELAEEGFIVFCVSPGWLKTDAANAHADLPVGTGVEGVLGMVRDSGLEVNGKFLNIHVPGWENNPGLNQYDGKELPW
ncbi:short chain oxidoreductase [Aspergillus sclerotioniger CBS 115572]|uniref:Short chain oxidoreductase n=1 Tax=Aspergillus sclerotioniger CBS 115572 TaxID=1450535 RepID=A0A317XC86_9EURO|nr:short chain oxidoreductase [Aspergillus sclerotioniger CBS 115572]PWY96129.1 short chain oxidoreductase [Aspergillus sclerotioniger CBS 115572]